MNHPFWGGGGGNKLTSCGMNLKSRWLSPNIISTMLVHTTIEKKNFIGNMSHHLQLLLFCAPTWLSYHAIENYLYLNASFSLNYFPFYENLYHPILITGLIFCN